MKSSTCTGISPYYSIILKKIYIHPLLLIHPFCLIFRHLCNRTCLVEGSGLFVSHNPQNREQKNNTLFNPDFLNEINDLQYSRPQEFCCIL